jgi:2-iminobutanoate/2-iminopropanoate deaminase
MPLCLFSFAEFTQNDSIVKFVNPATLAAPRGYSQASVVDLGKSSMIIISGQVPIDTQGNLVGKNDFAKDDIMLEIEATAIIPKK